MFFVLGLHRKVLAAVGGVTGLTSERSCQKLHPGLTEPKPPGSKMDLQLAKVEPISNGVSNSVTTCLRRGKVIAAREEKSENM